MLHWFKQLRRIQSLKHSLHSSNQGLNAQVYQLEVWSSILSAKGFVGGFRLWWETQRRHDDEDAPRHLPCGPPTAAQIDAIFANFRCCFHSFESWHLRQRGKLLEAKYDKSLKQLYLDLKPPLKPTPDLLVYQREYQILAVDGDSDLVHFEQTLDTRGSSEWTIEDQVVQISEVDGDLARVKRDFSLDQSMVICQKQFLSSVPEIHQDLLQHWNVRWNAMKQPTEEEWHRITSFFATHIPALHFVIPELTVQMWRSALKRFKKSAARGVDGVAAEDLLRLPEQLTLQLLGILKEIEQGTLPWPQQLLFGVVITIAKTLTPCTAMDYRPVVIYGVVYRAWSSIRSKQLLRQLAPYIPDACIGFVPTCECPQLWQRLQALIELSLQTDSSLCGMSTDLKKAFNTIPRNHSFELSRRLGVPDLILTPWRAFLTGCTRSFQLGASLSTPISSCTGMPEGCAMSVFAMVQLCAAFHKYMAEFSAGAKTMTYVDNICLNAPTVASLANAWVCLRSFFELWQMEFDPAKTYTWALKPEQRIQLRSFEFPCYDHATELGGAMNYGRRHRQSHIKERIDSIEVLWTRLKASRAPLWQKFRVLPSVFWSKSLYGNEAHSLAPSFFNKLRQQALKALRLNKAGVNGTLRLLLNDDFEQDPEFFHLRRTLFQFRRLCLKDPLLWSQWHFFMRFFDGTTFDGPFSKLLSLLSQVGWQVDPPNVVDHYGLAHDFLCMDDRALDWLLHDAWLSYVTTRVNQRTTMKLGCIDCHLFMNLVKRLDAHDRALTASLVSGAFISNAYKAKFDNSKSSLCEHCQQPDLHEHWIDCVGYTSHHEDLHDVENLSDLPLPLRAHLLVERCPLQAEMLHHLMEIPDRSRDFYSSPGTGLQELFSDGAHVGHDHALLGFSAWVVINASTGLRVASGHLSGIRQGSDVAEITALLAAMAWSVHFACAVRLWVDSKFVADTATWLWKHRFIPAHWHNRALWQQVLDLYEQMVDWAPVFCWIPSHVDPKSSQCPFDDWWIRWNGVADVEAQTLNWCRSDTYWTTRRQMIAYYDFHSACQQKLRKFYLQIARAQLKEPPLAPADELSEPVSCIDSFSLVSRLGEGWQTFLCSVCTEPKLYPCQFYVDLLVWLCVHESPTGICHQVSFLELSIGCLSSGLRLPFGSQDSWELVKSSDRMTRPTVAYVVGVVRKALRWLFEMFDFSDRLVVGLDLREMAVSIPLDGVCLAIPMETLQRWRANLVQFTRSRAVRKACDLARPM